MEILLYHQNTYENIVKLLNNSYAYLLLTFLGTHLSSWLVRCKLFIYLAIVYRDYFFLISRGGLQPKWILLFRCLGSIEVKTAKLNCIKKRFLKRFDRGEIVHMKMQYVILVDGIEQKI